MNTEKSFFLVIRAALLGSFIWLGLLVGSEHVSIHTDNNQAISFDSGLVTIDQASTVLSQFDWNSFTAFFSKATNALSFQQVDFKYRVNYECKQSELVLRSASHLFYRIKETIALNKNPANLIRTNVPPSH